MKELIPCPFCEKIGCTGDCEEEVRAKVAALQAEIDEQNELIESLTVSIEDLVELVQSNMADTCAWCLGREGKHDADCDAVRVLGPRVPRMEGGE